jgi:hypothetical protein
MLYGRDQADWDILAKEGEDFLIEKARLGDPTTYTEMNDALVDRTGLRRFDFASPADRAAIGYLLGLIVTERNRPETGLMISALVIYHGGSDAGSGFYALAQELGELPPGSPSASAKESFWLDQLRKIRDYYQKDR